jgi:23S rRNA (adenine2503-C2)-methyltransferase
MQNLRDITYEGFLGLATELGQKPYRAGQIYRWVFARGASSIDEMTDISLEIRERLKKTCTIEAPDVARTFCAQDGTVKVVFRLADGLLIQSVVMPEGKKATVCVSTQAGCALGCAFCLTGKGGFVRNLTLSEMAGQVLHARGIIGEDAEVTNIVFMGMGEPLLNYDILVDFIRILTDPAGLAISHNRITVSTSGITPAIERLGQEGLNVNLAVSLNAPDGALRRRIMPVDKKYPLAGLMKALRSYPLRGKKRLTLEYVLLGGVNDRQEDAKRLLTLIRGLRCKVNLIPFNPFEGAAFRRPSDEAVAVFRDILMKAGYLAVIRKSRGAEIGAACGQLGRGKGGEGAAEEGPEREKTLEAEGG